MAGTDGGFDAAAFRDGIHFAMTMGAPVDDSEQATFHFASTTTYVPTVIQADGIPPEREADWQAGMDLVTALVADSNANTTEYLTYSSAQVAALLPGYTDLDVTTPGQIWVQIADTDPLGIVLEVFPDQDAARGLQAIWVPGSGAGSQPSTVIASYQSNVSDRLPAAFLPSYATRWSSLNSVSITDLTPANLVAALAAFSVSADSITGQAGGPWHVTKNGLVSQVSQDNTHMRLDGTERPPNVDGLNVPFSPTAPAELTVTPTPVKVDCAIEYFDAENQPTSFGLLAPTRIAVTLLDEDYVQVKESTYVVVGGDRYDFRRTEPPLGLFDVGVYVMHFTSTSET